MQVQKQVQKQIRGSFASLRMTAKDKQKQMVQSHCLVRFGTVLCFGTVLVLRLERIARHDGSRRPKNSLFLCAEVFLAGMKDKLARSRYEASPYWSIAHPVYLLVS